MTETLPLKSQLAWQCRRGMLELDVILLPFFENHFEQLEQSEKEIFALLLQESDPDLYAWFMGFSTCNDSKITPMIQLIKDKIGLNRKS